MGNDNEQWTANEIRNSALPLARVHGFSLFNGLSYLSFPCANGNLVYWGRIAAACPVKNKKHGRGRRRGIAVEKRPLPTINWMEFTGTGEIAYTAFEKAILRFGLESGGNVRGLIILFFLARVRQCGENGIKEEIGWVMLCRSFFFFVSCLYILLIIIPEEREIVSLSTRRMRIFFLRPRGSISQFCVKLILFI